MMNHMLEKTKQLIVFGAILGLVFGTGSLGFAENAYADKKDDWKEKYKEIKEKIKEHKEKKQNHKKSKTLEDRCAKHDGKFSFKALVCEAIFAIQTQLAALQDQVDAFEDTTLSEDQVVEIVTNNGFSTGPHTVDTNAATICATGELLDGDGNCIPIPQGGGGGISSVELTTSLVRHTETIPSNDFTNPFDLTCLQGKITGLYVNVVESQGESPVSIRNAVYNANGDSVNLFLEHQGPFGVDPVIAEAVAICSEITTS